MKMLKNRLLYSGIIGVGILWSVTIISMIRSGLGLFDDRPISYLGTVSSSSWYFNSALFLSAVLFAVFGVYLYKILKLSRWFLIVYITGQTAQIFAAVFINSGNTIIVHVLSAFILAICIPIYMLIFAFSKNLDDYHTVAIKLAVLEVVFFILGLSLFIFVDKFSPLGEIMPALPFHIWIILTTIWLSASPAYKKP